jgi:hypothetical protein
VIRLCTGTLWATGVTGSLLYNWSRPLPTSLKIIHSCVAAPGRAAHAQPQPPPLGRRFQRLALRFVSRASLPWRRRMYAQALTIGALLAAAGVEIYGASHGMGKAPVDHSHEYQPKAAHQAAQQGARHA